MYPRQRMGKRAALVCAKVAHRARKCIRRESSKLANRSSPAEHLLCPTTSYWHNFLQPHALNVFEIFYILAIALVAATSLVNRRLIATRSFAHLPDFIFLTCFIHIVLVICFSQLIISTFLALPDRVAIHGPRARGKWLPRLWYRGVFSAVFAALTVAASAAGITLAVGLHNEVSRFNLYFQETVSQVAQSGSNELFTVGELLLMFSAQTEGRNSAVHLRIFYTLQSVLLAALTVVALPTFTVMLVLLHQLVKAERKRIQATLKALQLPHDEAQRFNGRGADLEGNTEEAIDVVHCQSSPQKDENAHLVDVRPEKSLVAARQQHSTHHSVATKFSIRLLRHHCSHRERTFWIFICLYALVLVVLVVAVAASARFAVGLRWGNVKFFNTTFLWLSVVMQWIFVLAGLISTCLVGTKVFDAEVLGDASPEVMQDAQTS